MGRPQERFREGSQISLAEGVSLFPPAPRYGTAPSDWASKVAPWCDVAGAKTEGASCGVQR
ncbi:unnamed protein product [Protopolystoma xenopodis]|uniref:Uncharacterized protein n=1 Tax=Protopolystoma xenopodis TaxID=117903 RepID=A0A3S5C9N2_9PLAT|nr:unnamed protein product [Protopolystoma xenopodis]